MAFPQYPFTRSLQVASPLLTGSDVYILQNMLLHNGNLTLKVTSAFDVQTSQALADFQSTFRTPYTNGGILDPTTAAAVVQHLSADGYTDDGATPASLGYLYKVHIQVNSNRSIEPVASLIAGNGTTLFSFTTRLHGAEGYPVPNWPSFNNTDSGLNQFTSDGSTPTGLCEFDLNSPEDNSTEFGPYPINRAVKGLKGNWQWLVTNDATTTIRDGILLHTGYWNITGWAPPFPMPNSLGCIHAYMDSIYTVWKILTEELGVVVRPNTDGALPYPYKCQGLLSIENV